MTATCFQSTPPPFLVIVQVHTELDWDDPAGWQVFPAKTEEQVERIWWLHDGRNFGTEAIGAYRWEPTVEGSSENGPGAYVPYEAWTRPRS